jgi:hypothetical protein
MKITHDGNTITFLGAKGAIIHMTDWSRFYDLEDAGLIENPHGGECRRCGGDCSRYPTDKLFALYK